VLRRCNIGVTNKISIIKVYRACYTYYIFPSIPEVALEKKGFSYRKTIKALGEKGLIGKSNGGCRTVYSVVKRIGDSITRFIEIRFE
jgi:hypothetical protein